MKIWFLLDENLAPRLKGAILSLDATIDVVRVGDMDTPPLQTPDPDILTFCEAEQRLLVTNNRKSMPEHLVTHWNAGAHFWGLFWVRPGASDALVAETIFVYGELARPKTGSTASIGFRTDDCLSHLPVQFAARISYCPPFISDHRIDPTDPLRRHPS